MQVLQNSRSHLWVSSTARSAKRSNQKISPLVFHICYLLVKRSWWKICHRIIFFRRKLNMRILEGVVLNYASSVLALVSPSFHYSPNCLVHVNVINRFYLGPTVSPQFALISNTCGNFGSFYHIICIF